MSLKTYFKDLLTVYTTTRLVSTRSPVIGIISCILFVIVWFSILGSIHLDIRRAYKSACPVHGAVTSKVLGFASTEHLTDKELSIDNPKLYRRTWESTDLVYPLQGGEGDTGSFTVVTNLAITANQKRGWCGELYNGTACKTDKDCKKGRITVDSHGVSIGKCHNSTGRCEITGWCPAEKDVLPRRGLAPLLEEVANFTVFLKNTVDFPGCGDYQGYNVANLTHSYIRKCNYHKETDPLCPKFKIGEIVKWTGHNFTDVAIQGGVFRIVIKWKCDFDYGRTTKDCNLKYKFSRVDDDEKVNGWNFETVKYSPNGDRVLTKHIGLKILIDLEGRGRQFDFFLLVTTLGSTIGFFSVTPLICDFLLDVLNAFRKREKCGDKLHKYCDRAGDESSKKEEDTSVNNESEELVVERGDNTEGIPMESVRSCEEY